MEDKIIMSRKEIKRIEVLQKIMDRKLSQVSGAKLLGVSYRQTKRLIQRMRKGGIANMAHRSRGKSSTKKIKEVLKKKIIKIYKEKHPEFGPTFALVKLQETHGLSLSVETLRKLLIEEGGWQCRKARKRDLHLWRERKHFEGEMLQIDGSHQNLMTNDVLLVA